MKRKIGYLVALLVIVGIAFVPGNANALDLTLAWDANTEENLGGYKIYYDTDGSGEPYNGTGAVQGPSPIDVGNVLEFTLTGLSDDLGTIYYFAATAYNTDDTPLESDYSNEVLSRCELIVTITGSGAVVQVPPGVDGIQASGIEVTVTAQPDQFWVFGEWGGDVSGTNPIGTVMTDGNNKAVTAAFAETAKYVLTATTTGNGTVTFDPAGGTYYIGQTVVVTATADAGWAFSEWTGAISGSTNPHSVIISANATINAVFVVSAPPTAPTDIKVVP